jgi:hypothetical protein
MTHRTRYFVIASLLVLGIGIGAGLVAYYAGFPTAFAQQGPDELQLVPRNASLVAYASVNEVMASQLRERIRQAMPNMPDGQRQFEEHTGINIETECLRTARTADRIPACSSPRAASTRRASKS